MRQRGSGATGQLGPREGSEGRGGECAPPKGAGGASSDHPFHHVFAEQEQEQERGRGRGTGLGFFLAFGLPRSTPSRPATPPLGKLLNTAESSQKPMVRGGAVQRRMELGKGEGMELAGRRRPLGTPESGGGELTGWGFPAASPVVPVRDKHPPGTINPSRSNCPSRVPASSPPSRISEIHVPFFPSLLDAECHGILEEDRGREELTISTCFPGACMHSDIASNLRYACRHCGG
jgi:hypothetical protein